jgi:uncharacterized protein (DUF1800 family)
MAKVFTGWSWNCPDGRTRRCFRTRQANLTGDRKAGTKPMVDFPDYHSTEEKVFLGVRVPPQNPPNPRASLKLALDTLAAHPNVGPFIGRQLIQRLVTSNPSPAYVAAVAAAFDNNGQGVRGDLGAVVRAILLHPEARTPSPEGGKVREPVLRMTALARAFNVRSASGNFLATYNEEPDTALSQVPYKAPSVFNFYRPGYTPPGGMVASAGLVAPEMQIADESAVAAYVRYVRDAIERGFGRSRDMRFDFSAEMTLADRADRLVDHVLGRLAGDADHVALRNDMVAAVQAIAVPAPNAWGGNQATIDRARQLRVYTAVLLAAAAPEFIVQK